MVMMKKHVEGDEDCACYACKHGMEKHRRREREAMKTHGWYGHFVFDGTPPDYHTHGVPASFGHPDLQVVLPMRPDKTHMVLTRLIEEIKGGRKFMPGDRARVESVCPAFDLGFALAEECGREVVRVILPDARGGLDRGEMDPEYAMQWEGTK